MKKEWKIQVGHFILNLRQDFVQVGHNYEVFFLCGFPIVDVHLGEHMLIGVMRGDEVLLSEETSCIPPSKC